MSWHSIFSATVFLGKATLVFGLICLLIFGIISQKQERIARYNKSGRIIDFLKIFSRW